MSNKKLIIPKNYPKFLTELKNRIRSAQITQQLAAQIPWYHNCVILDKTTSAVEREWYARATVEHGWIRICRKPTSFRGWRG
jgi:predicted nuclease of restriction endonuclease-like (RecB) superfamily